MAIQNVEIKKGEKSSVEISAEISADIFETYRAKAIQKLSEHISVPGFRKGHIPEDILVKKVGDMAVLEEMAQEAIASAYPEIIREYKIDAIGKPRVTITKIAKNEHLGFTITTAVMPEIKLSDYREAAREIMSHSEKVTVSGKELGEVIDNIRKQHGASLQQDGSSDKDANGQNAKNDAPDAKKEELPELNDDFVKTLGDFKNVEDFKEKLRENIYADKERKAKQKKRMELMERIIAKSTMDVPDILIEGELDNMMAQFEGDIARMGLKFEEYLKHIKKTREDLKKEWRTDAEKNAKVQLALNKIATTENIKADEKKVAEETKHLLEHYKNSPGTVSESRARDYVETILTNEAVFAFLENQK